MATTKTLAPTNQTITIAAFQGEKPDQRQMADAEGKLADAVNALNSQISQSPDAATPSSTYIDSGVYSVAAVGNIRIISFSDVKFKAALPSSQANNEEVIFTLPFTIPSGRNFLFVLQQYGSATNMIRFRARNNQVTPWYSAISVTTGEGFFGHVVCIL